MVFFTFKTENLINLKKKKIEMVRSRDVAFSDIVIDRRKVSVRVEHGVKMKLLYIDISIPYD